MSLILVPLGQVSFLTCLVVYGKSVDGVVLRKGGASREFRGVALASAPFLALQTVQRPELWGVLLALQAVKTVHSGVDNLNVVRHVGRLLDGNYGDTPLELVNDGDLLLLIDMVLRLRGRDSVRITKVKGHADAAVVRGGMVREQERVSNDAADKAADFGRRGLAFWSLMCRNLYQVVRDLHHHPLAWSADAPP